MTRAYRLLVAVAETDSTCSLEQVRGRPAWVCRCIHCRKRVVIPLTPGEPGSATLEHIVPRTHGGDDTPENLAIACASCNSQKGRKLDVRRLDDPKLQEVITNLKERRRATFRPR